MELEKNMQLYNQAKRLVAQEKILNKSEITFIILKNVKRKNKFIIGIRQHNKEFIFYPYGQKQIIEIDCIHYQSEYVSFNIRKCIEGYILFCLNNGYELIYMDLIKHTIMWNFIADYVDAVMNFLKNGVYHYLMFCNINGINHSLLEHYGQQKVNDIVFMLIENSFDAYDLLLSDFIGEKRIMLGVQKRFVSDFQMQHNQIKYIYRVIVVDINTLDIEYSDYHNMIENAFADYNNHFFTLSFNYYKTKELENNQLIKDFKKITNEFLC